MILSNETINLLKNYSSINQSIKFNQGNVLSTMSPMANILSSVTVSEQFPQDFAIYDINKFLGSIALFGTPTLEFSDKSVKIGNKIEYVFTDPEMIVIPPEKEINFPNPEIEIQLEENAIQEILKASGVLSLPHICVSGDGTNINVVSTDINNPSSDEYISNVGETDLTFNMIFKIENLKLLSGKYKVELSSKLISKFTYLSIDNNLIYYIATESESSFNEN